jgi:hypothetical protein
MGLVENAANFFQPSRAALKWNGQGLHSSCEAPFYDSEQRP